MAFERLDRRKHVILGSYALGGESYRDTRTLQVFEINPDAVKLGTYFVGKEVLGAIFTPRESRLSEMDLLQGIVQLTEDETDPEITRIDTLGNRREAVQYLLYEGILGRDGKEYFLK